MIVPSLISLMTVSSSVSHLATCQNLDIRSGSPLEDNDLNSSLQFDVILFLGFVRGGRRSSSSRFAFLVLIPLPGVSVFEEGSDAASVLRRHWFHQDWRCQFDTIIGKHFVGPFGNVVTGPFKVIKVRHSRRGWTLPLGCDAVPWPGRDATWWPRATLPPPRPLDTLAMRRPSNPRPDNSLE